MFPMRKGKFGIVLYFYPLLAFAAVILKAPWVCTLLLAVSVFVEKDEWAGRQTLQAWFLSLIVSFFSDALITVVSWVSFSFFSNVLSIAATVLSVIVYLGAIVLSILAITRVMKEQEADIPLLCEISYRLYGKSRPKPVTYAQPFSAPPQAGQPPYAPPQQPFQPGPGVPPAGQDQNSGTQQ